MPQLDGLRAFAVIAVAASHWIPHSFLRGAPLGTGVQLFFVLSGFLITGILLRSRPAERGVSMPAALRIFYTRRFLRIFPLYYGVLIFCLLAGVGPIYATWPWHFSYLSNIYYAWHPAKAAVVDPFLHLWSLSVEEQFYLLWPLIALVAGRRTLAIILYSSIAGSMVFRLGVDYFVSGLATVRYLTPSCVDAFAVGGLLAHARHYEGPAAVERLAKACAAVGAIGLLLSFLVLERLMGAEPARRVGHTFLVIIYGAVVARASVGFGGLPGRVLTLGPVQYLGKISYGVYVYHYFAAAAVTPLAMRWGFGAAPESTGSLLVLYSVFTVGVAALSWHLYEWPINRLKRHFVYPESAGRVVLPKDAPPVFNT